MRVQRESFIYQFVMPSQKVAEVSQKIGFYYYLTQKNQRIYFKRKQIQNYQGIDEEVIQKSISSTIQKYNQQLEMSKEGISKYIQRYSSIILSYPFACFMHQPYQEILINFIKKQLSISAKISLMIEIAKGVDDLHSKEICIKALKPSSIFIIDSTNEHFQISFAQLTDIYQNMGLINEDKIRKMKMDPYTPPQILKYQDYSTRSDIWSLGLIFYQIWFGKKLCKSHHQLDLSNIFPQNAPSWMINFLSKMICVNPKHRYNIKDIQRLLKNAKLCSGVLSKSL